VLDAAKEEIQNARLESNQVVNAISLDLSDAAKVGHHLDRSNAMELTDK
jgi:hypothetical protein